MGNPSPTKRHFDVKRTKISLEMPPNEILKGRCLIKLKNHYLSTLTISVDANSKIFRARLQNNLPVVLKLYLRKDACIAFRCTRAYNYIYGMPEVVEETDYKTHWN